MSKYIEVDAFMRSIRNIRDMQDFKADTNWYSAYDEFLDLIEDFPIADVTEVIRCKDCLFGYRCFQVIHGISDSWVECQNPDGLNRTVSDNGFCSASIERREE